MTDSPSDDEAPITPEVVDGGGDTAPWRRGAAARKRRAAPPAPSGGDADAGGGAGAGVAARGMRTVTLACFVLGMLGVLGSVSGVGLLSDPDGARCSSARSLLDVDAEDANDDGDLSDEALDARKDEIDDLECTDAIAEANAREDEKDVASKSAIRNFGLAALVIGAAQVVTGLFTARTRARRWRTGALIATALGILGIAGLGIIGLAVIGFIVYGLVFSGDARATFGDPGGPRIFRPRTS